MSPTAENFWTRKLEGERLDLKCSGGKVEIEFKNQRIADVFVDKAKSIIKSIQEELLEDDQEFYDALGIDFEDYEEAVTEQNTLETVDIPHMQARNHPLWNEMEEVTKNQLHYANLGVGQGGWSLFAEDGEMKLYKRIEFNGKRRGVDPLKAVHTVQGVTAYEMCHHFFNPHVRMEWETTLDKMNLLEAISKDAIVFHQVHKRVWPTTQRDAVFWSHIQSDKVNTPEDKTWIVCNHSTDHQKAPEAKAGKCIRANVTISMVCQTIVDKPDLNGVSRDKISCKVTYSSQINLGGWAPTAVIKAVYKREYPRFLKKFTQYVYDKCKDNPVKFKP